MLSHLLLQGSTVLHSESWLQRAERLTGPFTVADLRYWGKDTAAAGSVILNVDEVRQILRDGTFYGNLGKCYGKL